MPAALAQAGEGGSGKSGGGVVLPDAPSITVTAPEPMPAEETEAQRKARVHAQAEQEVKQEETQRLLTVVPNFDTVLSGRAAPMDKGQKTDLAVHATFDPFNFVAAFLLAGVSELDGSHRGYGWGAPGYFERAAANLGDVFDSTMLAGAVYPILLHQDPRYFRQAARPARARIRHALAAPFVCRGDNGAAQPNYSNILGNLTAGAISNAYYPAQDRGVSLSFINFSVVMLEGSLGNIALEFVPDLEAYWKRRHNKDAPDAASAGPRPALEGEPPRPR